MKMFRLPLPVWALFITAILVVLAVPVLSAAAAMLFCDLNFGTSFFSASNYGQPRKCCKFVVEPNVGVDDREFNSSPRKDRE
jgi:hypothetical protein